MDDWPAHELSALAPDVDIHAAQQGFAQRRRHQRRRRTRTTLAAAVAVSALAGIAFVYTVADDPDKIVVTSDTAPERSSTVEPTVPATIATTDVAAETPSTTIAPPPSMALSPFGVSSNELFVRAYQLDIETRTDPNTVGGPVLDYALQLGFDPAGRSGTIVPGTETTDGQLSIETLCSPADCRFEPNDQEILITLNLTIRTTESELTTGTHTAPFTVRFDDDTTATFDVQYDAQRQPSADLVSLVEESTAKPVQLQRVLGVGNFAYHAIAAFDSIWIVGKHSGTVARIDDQTGELLATISLGPDAWRSQTNRLAAGSDAIYAVGSPVVRIDPTTNTSTRTDGGAASFGIIANGDTVWTAGRDRIDRLDPDGTITTLIDDKGFWFDLAFSNGLVWAVSQNRADSRLIGFDGNTGDIWHDIQFEFGDSEFPVRIVADEQAIVVGTDSSGGGGRTGRILVIDPATGQQINEVVLDSRPEGIVLTNQHIWTSEAILDRPTLKIRLDNQAFGFTITRGPDGSIWGTSAIPGTATNEGLATRWAPGDYRD